MKSLAKSRDMKVMDGLETFRYMRSDQIADIYFTSIKKRDHRIKKVSERMKRLHSLGYVQRMRFPGEPYIYTLSGSAYNNKIQHYLTVVDVYITPQKLRPSGSVLRFETETKFSDLICDLWVEYRNEFRQEKKEFFIEVELNSSGDILEKIEKYQRLFRHRSHETERGIYLYILYSKIRTPERRI